MKKGLLILLMLALTACGTSEEKDSVEEEKNDIPEQVTEGKVINVPEDYETITVAIENALDGDEIIVAEGTYNEDINFEGRNIVLTSSNPTDSNVVENTIIMGLGDGPVVRFENGESSDAKIAGFTITGGNYTEGGAIIIAPMTQRTSPTITNNVFEGNVANYGGAIYVHESNSEITNNVFRNNHANQSGGAVFTSSNANVLITDNRFENNEADSFGGALRITLSNPQVKNNVFTNNTAYWGGGAISVGSDANPVFENNEYDNNTPANEDFE